MGILTAPYPRGGREVYYIDTGATRYNMEVRWWVVLGDPILSLEYFFGSENFFGKFFRK
jgi:hypothetical protein